MAEILVQRDGPVGTVVISNVDKFNAMTTQMWRDLPLRIAELDADPAIHAIVLVGDGDKAFVSGADISQFGVERGDAASQQAYAAAGDRCCVEGRVQRRAYLGESWDYHITIAGSAEPLRVSARPNDVFEVDQQVFAHIDPAQITFLPKTEETADGVAA